MGFISDSSEKLAVRVSAAAVWYRAASRKLRMRAETSSKVAGDLGEASWDGATDGAWLGVNILPQSFGEVP